MILIFLIDVENSTDVSFLYNLDFYVFSLLCKVSGNDNIEVEALFIEVEEFVDWAFGQNFVVDKRIDFELINDKSSDLFMAEIPTDENSLLLRANMKLDF